MQEMQIQSLGWEDPLEKKIEIHSSIFAWRIPWTEEPSRLHSVHGVKRVRHDLATKQPTITVIDEKTIPESYVIGCCLVAKLCLTPWTAACQASLSFTVS